MFFEKILSLLNFSSDENSDSENQVIKTFLVFFGIVLLISILISLLKNTFGGLFFYGGIFAIYRRQIRYHEKWRNDFKNIILKNNLCKLFYIIYIFLWIIFILIGDWCIIKII